MNKKRYLFVLLATFCLSSNFVLSQNFPGEKSASERDSYGIFGDFNSNSHSADFLSLPGTLNCGPNFTSGTGTGISLGIFYEMPIASKFSLGLRAGYSGYGADLQSSESTTLISGNYSVSGNFNHTISTKISVAGIEPLVAYNAFDKFSFLGGLQAAFLMQKSYTQQEVVATPNFAFDAQGNRIRNSSTGDLTNTSGLQLAFLLGANYRLPLNSTQTMFLSPEILYSMGLSNVVSDLSWKMSAIRFGLAFTYSPAPEQKRIPIPEPEPKKPEPKKPEPKKIALTASITAAAVSPIGSETPIGEQKIKAEEFVSSSMLPVLNYIFFDDNSFDLPARYRKLTSAQARTFSPDKLTNYEALPMYYHVLNILGRRMTDNPKTSISITGCNSDAGSEQGNKELSRRRAETVRNYLRDVWNIEAKRMAIASRNLPEKPTNSSEPDGIAENRRVEIQSDSWNLLEPLIAADTIHTISPTAVRFHVITQSEAGVKNWSLSLIQNGKTMKEYNGTGTPPATLDWLVEKEKDSLESSTQRVEYSLSVADLSGQKIATPMESLPVEQITVEQKRRQQTADKRIDRYSLILFDFAETELNAANIRIAEFVKKRIEPTAHVEITGYTDRIGDPDRNQRLSEARAKATAQKLGVQANPKGVGKSSLLYDNNLPEGRFYSRTVEVLVETPVK